MAWASISQIILWHILGPLPARLPIGELQSPAQLLEHSSMAAAMAGSRGASLGCGLNVGSAWLSAVRTAPAAQVGKSRMVSTMVTSATQSKRVEVLLAHPDTLGRQNAKTAGSLAAMHTRI